MNLKKKAKKLIQKKKEDKVNKVSDPNKDTKLN